MGTARDVPRARVGARGRRSACGGDARRWSIQAAGACAEVLGLGWALGLALFTTIFFRLPVSLGLSLAGLIGPACLAALLPLFYAGLTRLYGRTVAALATGALALVPALTLQAPGGDADVPLAMYAGASALYLLLWWRGRRHAD